MSFIRKDFFQNNIILQCSFHIWFFIEMDFIHSSFILKTITLFLICKIIYTVVNFSTFDVRRILTIFSQWFRRRNVILSKAIYICVVQFKLRNRILVSVYNLFNYIINKNVCVFIFNRQIAVILNVLIIVFKYLLCVINSFPSNFFFSLFVDLCQIIDAYVIIDFMMTE